MAKRNNKNNARVIVHAILDETFTRGLPVRIDAYALANRIIDSLAEVYLITEDN